MGELYPHQVEILKSLEKGARYVVAGCRVGKTRPVIAFLDAKEGIKLVLTKKTAIKGWISELKALNCDLNLWKVTNYEQVRTAGWDMGLEWGALVCDEAHVLGKYPKPAETTKVVAKLSVRGPRVGVSATPCAESHSQLFHQSKALRFDLWGDCKNFYAFHRAHGVPDPFKANGRMLESYKKCDDSVWTSFAERCCVLDRAKVAGGFVEATDRVVPIEAPEVLDMCHRLKRDGIIQIDGRNIVAETPLAVAQKCQQICAGWVLDDEGLAVFVHSRKADWVRDNLKGLKTVVLTTFKAEVGGYASIGLGLDAEAFVEGRSGTFVGNIQSYARGVDFSVADALVLTGCPWSSETFLQSRDRLLRRDRVRDALVYYPVIAGGIDEMIYNKVAIEKRAFTAQIYERAGHST
jgi:hypothetical protein